MSSLFDRFFKGKPTLPTAGSKEAAASVPASKQFDVVYAEALRAATDLLYWASANSGLIAIARS